MCSRSILRSAPDLIGSLGLACAAIIPAMGQDPMRTPFKDQPYQRPESCLPCHQRQFDELKTSVKSGYRNVSPLFNALELAGNFLGGGLLRPVYSDSTKTVTVGAAIVPLQSNLVTTSPSFTLIRQVQAGFCVSCHVPHVIQQGDIDNSKREVPELGGVLLAFRPDLIRPLRDFHLVDGQGQQVLPDQIGGPPPPGAQPSLGAAGVTCDVCHNVTSPSLSRSLQRDGFANVSLNIDHTVEKIGPFSFPLSVRGEFHVASTNQDKIAFLRSSALCNSCHDVRVPVAGQGPGNLQHYEQDPGSTPGLPPVTFYRLENLSSEWQVGAYNSTNNPFGKIIRCQDCHMSQFPYTQNSTYQVGDMTVTSPTPAVFAQNFAAVPGISTEGDFPLPRRAVVNHNFTGVDVPLMSADELHARLGNAVADPYQPGLDEYGQPKAVATRRADLLKAAVRINLDKTDKRAKVGEDFNVRVQAVALTGHRFPAGFSQERTTYINLTVKDANGFLLYQSGYLVDKPHPDTGELQPDGNLDDEDLEHSHAIANPGRMTTPYATGAGTNGHTNQVFAPGPDDGPETRVYAGIPEGLVLFRNELTRIFLPAANGDPTAADSIGRSDANGTVMRAAKPHFEETFSAGFANSVDNFRSLQPLVPRVFRYQIKLPTAAELRELGVTLQGPLQVHAQVNFEHFPPLFLRFLARTTGPNGPAGHDLNLLNESVIDAYLKNVTNLASADFTVDLDQ